MHQLKQTIVATLMSAALIAVLGGLFSTYLKSEGYEVRIAKIEDLQIAHGEGIVKNGETAQEIKSRQTRMLFKLCLLVNDGNISKCDIQ